jgi:hypothetical protein
MRSLVLTRLGGVACQRLRCLTAAAWEAVGEGRLLVVERRSDRSDAWWASLRLERLVPATNRGLGPSVCPKLSRGDLVGWVGE